MIDEQLIINESMELLEDEKTKNMIVREEVLKRKARTNQLKMKTRIRRRKMGAIHKSLRR